MFRVELTAEAINDVATLRRFDQRRVLDDIERHLAREAGRETRRRKKLRPNLLAEWELRVDEFRVFYDIVPPAPADVDDGTVRVVAVGWKSGSKLFIHGEEFEL